MTHEGRVGFRFFVATAPCQRCGSMVGIDEYSPSTEIPDGLRYVDVPCPTCDALYTFEITKKPEPLPPETGT